MHDRREAPKQAIQRAAVLLEILGVEPLAVKLESLADGGHPLLGPFILLGPGSKQGLGNRHHFNDVDIAAGLQSLLQGRIASGVHHVHIRAMG